jgi:hypothetical protein
MLFFHIKAILHIGLTVASTKGYVKFKPSHLPIYFYEFNLIKQENNLTNDWD